MEGGKQRKLKSWNWFSKEELVWKKKKKHERGGKLILPAPASHNAIRNQICPAKYIPVMYHGDVKYHAWVTQRRFSGILPSQLKSFLRGLSFGQHFECLSRGPFFLVKGKTPLNIPCLWIVRTYTSRSFCM